MLARTAQRNREIAIRLSLGSTLRQLFQLIALESFILTALATAGGILIAYVALHALYSLVRASLPRATEVVHMHGPVLVFASAACCLTVLICSAVPLFYLRGIGIADGLKQSSGRGTVGGGQRTRQIVVAAQVALSCVLCVGAVLLSRTLIALHDAPLGFDSENVTVMYADAPAFQLSDYVQAIQTFKTAIASIETLPGVRGAAAIMGLPTGRYGSNGYYWVEGVHIHPGQDLMHTNWTGQTLPYANFAVATSDYFKTVGIPLVAGRDFDESDRYDRPFTAIVSDSLARHSFGSANPIGRRIYCGLDSPKPMTIVGIVGDVRQDSPASSMQPAIYMPLAQHPYYANEVELVVRSERNSQALMPLLRQVMAQHAPEVAIELTTLSEMVQSSISAPRFRAILSVAFAVVAALLALVGIYAVLLFEVNQEHPDIGVRMALGATAASIMGLILRRAFAMCFVGLVAGLAAAAVMSRFVSSLVYGVKPLDPLTYYLAGMAVLLFVGIAAAGPTWQASKVDAVSALRND
ncbi:MAG: FtsX-like permease family protein [Acidobacteriaceae bacterium]|nr:FtsX-like permease family protein [Acidobacteriaceae bacterium]